MVQSICSLNHNKIFLMIYKMIILLPIAMSKQPKSSDPMTETNGVLI